MVFTPARIRYLLEQDRIGREKRGGHDYLTEKDLRVIASLREAGHRNAIEADEPAPFHRKHRDKA